MPCLLNKITEFDGDCITLCCFFCFYFRGVIQLFNAVRKYQTDMEEKLKEAKTETKKERLYKNIDKGKFLEMINRDEKSAQTLDTEDAAPEVSSCSY